MEKLLNLESRDQSVSSEEYNTKPSSFAEMYMENPFEVQSVHLTVTICTWKNIPTIDDW